MTEPEESTPAVWDPTARNGAGGWVRRRDPATAAMRHKPESAEPPQDPNPSPEAQPPEAGTVGDPRAASDLSPPPVPPPLPAQAGPPASGPRDVGDEPTSVIPAVPAEPTEPAIPAKPNVPPRTEFDQPLGRPYVPTAKDLPKVTEPQAPQASRPPQLPQAPRTPPAPQAPPTGPGAGYGYPPPGHSTSGYGAPGYGAPGYRAPGGPAAPSYGPPPGAPGGPPASYQGATTPGQGFQAPNQPPLYPIQPHQQQYGQPAAYPGGPGGPGDPSGGDGGDGGRRNLPLLIALVVVVAALLGVGVVWGLGLTKNKQASNQTSTPPVATSGAVPTGSSAQSASPSDSASASQSASPSPSDTAKAQAQASAVDQLLANSTSSRSQVANAVQAVDNCTDYASVSNAQSALTQAAQARKSLSQQAASLDVSQLPAGAAAAMQTLSRAWSESAAADTDFANWAGAMANGGCSPGNAPHNTDWNNGLTQSTSATTDKKSFVAAWNPIATQYGLATRTDGEI